MIIKADFSRITGTIKPMHAVGQPPMMQLNDRMMHYLPEAGIPYARLHDTQGLFGSGTYVDIPNIFRNFDADVNDPASYDFAMTDEFLKKMAEYQVEPFFRLGVTIENYAKIRSYRLDPPADFQKWAEICEHIILHYNHGWNNGFEFKIKYWEIWNEPELCYLKNMVNPMWHGTPQDFYRFYTVAATHLKKCFGNSIQIGGYAACGFYQFEKLDPGCIGFAGEPETPREACIKFAHEFLEYISRAKAPLDYFSWHSYTDIDETVKMTGYVRRMLTRYGFSAVPDIINEWNNCCSIDFRHTQRPAALALGMMLAVQKTPTVMMNYYDARIGQSVYGGIFNPGDWTPYLTYYAFAAFNQLYRLKHEVLSESSEPVEIPVAAASDGRHMVLVLANTRNEPVQISFSLEGVDPSTAEITMLNNLYHYTRTGMKLKDGMLEVPPETGVEIHFEA